MKLFLINRKAITDFQVLFLAAKTAGRLAGLPLYTQPDWKAIIKYVAQK